MTWTYRDQDNRELVEGLRRCPIEPGIGARELEHSCRRCSRFEHGEWKSVCPLLIPPVSNAPEKLRDALTVCCGQNDFMLRMLRAAQDEIEQLHYKLKEATREPDHYRDKVHWLRARLADVLWELWEVRRDLGDTERDLDVALKKLGMDRDDLDELE